MAIVKAKGATRSGTPVPMESHPAVLSFPRKRESKSWAKAWLNARFRGHPAIASTQVQFAQGLAVKRPAAGLTRFRVERARAARAQNKKAIKPLKTNNLAKLPDFAPQ